MQERIAKTLTARKGGALIKGQGVNLQAVLAAHRLLDNQGVQEETVVAERLAQHQ